MAVIYRHLAKLLDWREAACGHVMTPEDTLPTQNHGYVDCPACKKIVDRRRLGQDPEWEEHLRSTRPTPEQQYRRDWTVAAVAGDTDLGFEDWKIEQGVGAPTPNHTPPRMVDGNGLTDGIFEFYDDSTERTLDVRPTPDGSVRIDMDGSIFNLHHLDRADLIRALLHDFHYSPERGGPHDQD